MFFFEDTLGIDIRLDRIDVALVGKSLKAYHVLALRSRSLQLENGAERDQQIVDFLRSFTSDHGLGKAVVHVAIPRVYALTRFFSLPILPPDDVNKFIRFEAARHVPSDLDDYYFDTQIIEQKIGAGMKVLFVAIPKDIVQAHIILLKRADIIPDVLDLSPFGAINALKFSGKLDDKPDTVALLQPSATQMDITLIKGGAIRLTRSINRVVTGSSTASEGGYMDERTDPMITTDTLTPLEPPDMTELVRSLSDSLALSGISSEAEGRVDEIIIPHNGTVSQMLTSALASQYQARVMPYTLPQNCQVPEELQRDIKTRDLTSVLGLAFRSYLPDRLNFNFLPPHFRVVRRRYGLMITVTLLIGILLTLGCWVGASVYNEVQTLALLKARVTQLRPQLDEIRQIKATMKENKEMMSYFRELAVAHTMDLDIFRELTVMIPENYWINYLLIEDKHLQLHGSGSSPESLVSKLEASPLLEGVKLERVVNDRFTIEANISEIINEESPADSNGELEKDQEKNTAVNEQSSGDEEKQVRGSGHAHNAEVNRGTEVNKAAGTATHNSNPAPSKAATPVHVEAHRSIEKKSPPESRKQTEVQRQMELKRK